MHLVSIIYLFISASKFGPGSHLKWCLTKWQLFFWWAGVAKTSASALQLQQFLLLRYVAFHEGSDHLAKSRQNPTDFDWNSTLLTAGLGTSVCDVIQRLEGEGIFFPWLSRPPSVGDQSGTASQLSLEVVFTICLCTSKNTLVLIEIYSMSSASIPCRLQHRTPPVLELALHSCVPRGICAKRKKNEAESHQLSWPTGFRDIRRFNSLLRAHISMFVVPSKNKLSRASHLDCTDHFPSSWHSKDLLVPIAARGSMGNQCRGLSQGTPSRLRTGFSI